jgi:hypothetical protein
MSLPPGVMDPLTLHELALELNMTVAELTYGRGTPMSAHELCVSWPLFWEYQRREAQRREEQENQAQATLG